MNLRSGRFKGRMASDAASYTSSLEFDRRIFRADVKCNLAHTTMLQEEGIIAAEDAQAIIRALRELEEEGIAALKLDPSVEDIHMAVENYVTQMIGEKAGFMHTAKSRNDQVATDLRIVLKEEIEVIQEGILTFITLLVGMAEDNLETVLVGYTHLQHAQPTTFAHHLLSYAQALKRDYERLEDAYKRVDQCPLGAAALTTTSFPINRERTAQLLGFSHILENSLDAVSSRDFITETVSALALMGITLSRICEELIIWSSYEFGLLEIGDEFSSTSSIMPQKKNPDVAEVARAKAISLQGELVTILSVTKALPQSYNRDLQEVTPHLWKAVDTALETLNLVREMLASVEFNQKRGEELAHANFSTATELADLMVQENHLPFRVAHQIVGRVVSTALKKGMKPDEIDSQFLDEIAREVTGRSLNIPAELVKKALDPLEVVKSRTVPGGPAPSMVQESIQNLRNFMDGNL
ncbi:MAG: argininosuccinate lyase [Methanobacteriaceae archaeon]